MREWSSLLCPTKPPAGHRSHPVTGQPPWPGQPGATERSGHRPASLAQPAWRNRAILSQPSQPGATERSGHSPASLDQPAWSNRASRSQPSQPRPANKDQQSKTGTEARTRSNRATRYKTISHRDQKKPAAQKHEQTRCCTLCNQKDYYLALPL